MSNILEKTYAAFIEKKDVASFIKFFSVITWEKIGFVRYQDGLRFHEVTATQNLLFQFRILSKAFPTTVVMFEAVKEKTNGNDIELFIKVEGGYVFFACQAKIVQKNGVYTYIDHLIGKKTSKVRQQIDDLIAYADEPPVTKTGQKVKRGIPIYLFYNFSSNPKALAAISPPSTDDFEVYGCTYVDARTLIGDFYDGAKWIKKPSFSDLHPRLAKPFYTLFNFLGKPKIELFKAIYSPDNIENAMVDAIIDNLTLYERPLLNDEDSDYWIPVTQDLPESQIIRNSEQIRSTYENTEPGFNPKYRIVIGDSEIDATIAKWLFM